MATNAGKDYSGSHLWANSSIPFGGTLPSRGAHGNPQGISHGEGPAVALPSNRVFFLNPMSGTNTIPGGYMTSFYKKVGSSSHRRHQGPSMESIASSESFTWPFFTLIFQTRFYLSRLSFLLQIMQHGSLAGVRQTPLPTRVPRVFCLALQYRLSTGEQTGPPSMATASVPLWSSDVLQERSTYYGRDLRSKECCHLQRVVLVL